MRFSHRTKFNLLLVTSVTLAACASHQSAAPPRSPAALLTGVVTTSGAARTTAAFSSSTGTHGAWSCTAAAREGNTAGLDRFVVATGSSGLVYGGFSIAGYHGPGTYRVSGGVPDGLLIQIHRVQVTFDRTSASSAVVRVAPDASGRATFANYRAHDGRLLSGTLRWSCRTTR